jgi:hypothetical protein
MEKQRRMHITEKPRMRRREIGLSVKKTQHPDFRHKPRHPQHTTQKEQSNKTRFPISTPSATPVNHKYTKGKDKRKR